MRYCADHDLVQLLNDQTWDFHRSGKIQNDHWVSFEWHLHKVDKST